MFAHLLLLLCVHWGHHHSPRHDPPNRHWGVSPIEKPLYPPRCVEHWGNTCP